MNYLNIDNHIARPMTLSEEGQPFNARCFECGNRECYADEYIFEGEVYCDSCYDAVTAILEEEERQEREESDPLIGVGA